MHSVPSPVDLLSRVTLFNTHSSTSSKRKPKITFPKKSPKTQEQELAEAEEEAKRQEELDDTYISQKQYYEKIKKEREEYESEKEKIEKQYQYEEQRDKREFEVNVAQVDYARIRQENVNIVFTESFKHLEELYYFISNLRVQLSEENIRKCLEGFLTLAERINSKDLEKPQFHDFVEILAKNVMFFSSNETLILLMRFADLYIVEDETLWKNLERKIFQRFQQFTPDELISCVIHFSNQNEGSEVFYDQFEKVITPHLSNLEVGRLVALAQAYYQVKKGTASFFSQVHKEIKDKMDSATRSDLVRLCIVYSSLNVADKYTTFERLEDLIKNKIDEFNISEICIIAEAFGFDHGSEEFLLLLQEKVLEKLPELEFEQFILVLRGFIYTFRGSRKLFDEMKSRIEMFLPRLELTPLALIGKAYHITENDDKAFEALLERHVISSLKRLDQLTTEDLYEVASSYNVTRTGSRELYKILEFVIRDKLEEIAKNTDVARGLYYLYTTSGLCSPELLKKLQFIV